jgi:hypothetical protein
MQSATIFQSNLTNVEKETSDLLGWTCGIERLPSTAACVGGDDGEGIAITDAAIAAAPAEDEEGAGICEAEEDLPVRTGIREEVPPEECSEEPGFTCSVKDGLEASGETLGYPWLSTECAEGDEAELSSAESVTLLLLRVRW